MEHFLTGKDSSCVEISTLAKKGFWIQPYCSVLWKSNGHISDEGEISVLGHIQHKFVVNSSTMIAFCLEIFPVIPVLTQFSTELFSLKPVTCQYMSIYFHFCFHVLMLSLFKCSNMSVIYASLAIQRPFSRCLYR